MSKGKVIGEATQEQIDSWKKKYGQVVAIKHEEHICYMRKPDRKILGYASVAGKTNPTKFNEVLFDNCFLGGSDLFKTDDQLFYGAVNQLAELVQAKEVEMVNL